MRKKKQYLKFFGNSAQEESTFGRSDVQPLNDSREGLSYWTADEKELFFTALARHGRDELPALSKAVGTKSEIDVQSYLLALESGVQNRIETTSHRKYFCRADVPAACEVAVECELELEQAANALAVQTEKGQIEAERRTHGDHWLIDAGKADEIDALLDAEEGSGRPDGGTQNLLTPATTFLDITLFLQLSRSLFMNGPADGHWNYRTSPLLDHSFLAGSDNDGSNSRDNKTYEKTPTEPAIYHSALDDLYDLIRRLTRKLVHATLFQATSRLRAKHNDAQPTATVITDDVHVAADLLGLRQDWKTYWAKLPRRAGLEVYSESDKYKRGRTGTKNGVKLTYDEVEIEMGLEESVIPYDGAPVTEPDRLNGINDSADESSGNQDADSEDSDVSSDGIIEVQLERERRKRRRGLSPDSFARAEERYMQALDRRADRDEENGLRELLGLEGREVVVEEDEMLERPKLKKQCRGEIRTDWREGTEKMAAWEVECVRKLKARQEESSDDEDVAGLERSEHSDSGPGSEITPQADVDGSEGGGPDDDMADGD